MPRILTRLLVALTASVCALASSIGTSAATSCEYPFPEPDLSELDAAFVGRPLELLGLMPAVDGEWGIVRFSVETALKGDLGETAVVLVQMQNHTLDSPYFMNGVHLRDVAGSVMIRSADVPIALEGCTDNRPENLNALLEPLPESDPSLAIEAVSFGRDRDTDMRFVGRDGTVVSYIEAEGDLQDGELCADARTAVTLSDREGQLVVDWVEIATASSTSFELKIETQRGLLYEILGCSNDLTVLIFNGAHQVVVTEAGVTNLSEHDGRFGKISRDGGVVANWATGQTIVLNDLDDGSETRIEVDDRVGRALTISPDGQSLAYLTDVDGRPFVTVSVLDGEPMAIRERPNGPSMSLDWATDDVLLSGGPDAIVAIDSGIRPARQRIYQNESLHPDHDVRAGSRVVISDRMGGLSIFDVLSESRHPLTKLRHFPGWHTVRALDAPIVFEGASHQPAAPRFPITGARLARTADEFWQMADPTLRDRIIEEARPRPQAQPEPAAAVRRPVDNEKSPSGAIVELAPLGLTLILVCALVFFFGRSWRRNR